MVVCVCPMLIRSQRVPFKTVCVRKIFPDFVESRCDQCSVEIIRAIVPETR